MSEEAEEKEVEEEAPKKKSSLVLTIVMFLLITGMAAGAGFGVSMLIEPGKPEMTVEESTEGEEGEEADAKPKVDVYEKAQMGGEAKEEEEGEGVKNAYAKPLAPILTNLAAPEDVWVRLELAVVGQPDISDALLEQIHQDLFAYMRTVKLHHVEGPSGYQNLKAELSERASMRSSGAAKAVLVRTLVFE